MTSLEGMGRENWSSVLAEVGVAEEKNYINKGLEKYSKQLVCNLYYILL